MKVAFYTLGCKVNQYETQAMSEQLKNQGFETVHHSEEADVYIVNSCTVTAVSNQKTRQAVRTLKRNHPNSVVVLCGCMSQAYPEQAKELTQADIVIGNTDHSKIAELVAQHLENKNRVIAIEKHPVGEAFESTTITGYDERTRAIVKIEDGCDRYCSYCQIPYARGHVRSKPIEELRQEAITLANNGYLEIVLVGINLSSYKTANGENLADAVECVNAVDGIKRVRLGSLEPDKMSDDMLTRFANCEKFCPQFHLALQSGCDKTLDAMNRHYDTAFFKDICTRIRSSFKDATITTDLMVGFPGESEEDFTKSLNFCKEIGFEKVHVFPYSIREGTRAAKFPNQVEKSVKTRRAATVTKEMNKLRSEFLKSQVGKRTTVLIERQRDDGLYEGYTPNYTPVKVTSLADICTHVVSVEITGASDDICFAKVVEN